MHEHADTPPPWRRMPIRLSPWLAWALLVALLVGLFYGGTLPGAGGLFPAPWDKFAHIGCWAALTVALLALRPGQPWLCALLALGIGAADEIHQIFLPGRSAEFEDWLADGLGTLLAVLAWRAHGRPLDPSEERQQ